MAFDRGDIIELIAASAAPPTTGVGVLKAYKLPATLKTERRRGVVKKIWVSNLTLSDLVVYFDDGDTDAVAITAIPKFPPLNIGAKQTVVLGDEDELNWDIVLGIVCGSPGALAAPAGINVQVLEVDVRS